MSWYCQGSVTEAGSDEEGSRKCQGSFEDEVLRMCQGNGKEVSRKCKGIIQKLSTKFTECIIEMFKNSIESVKKMSRK